MRTKSPSPRRRTGLRAPESKPAVNAQHASAQHETAQEKIARLEKELEDARLRVDLYEEIINVAERKFAIQIIKKAGTKQ